jgi:mono/diheme cytochrome c family protein
VDARPGDRVRPRPGVPIALTHRDRAVRLALAGALAATVAGAAREGEAPKYSAAAIARGRYLSHAVCECFECHSPLYDDDRVLPIETKLGAGDILNEKTRLVAPNITPDPETGAGRWTDDQLVRAIRQGISHDGRRLSVVMPYPTLSILTNDDAHAIVAYLRSLPPVRHSTAEVDSPSASPSSRRSRQGPPATAERSRHAQGPRRLPCASRALRALSLAAAGHGLRSTLHRRDMEFAGGRRFETKRYFDELDDDPVRPPAEAARLDPPSFVTSPNITRIRPASAYFDEAHFIQTIRTGRVAGRRPLTRAMLWFEFRKLTDDDLGAIFEFLRSVPPVRHRVNNADPPTYCPRCGRRHGLGELNSP